MTKTAGITRRRVLTWGLLGSALLGLAGLVGQRTQAQQPSRALRALSVSEYATILAIADCLCPGGDGLPPASAVGVGERVDDFMALADPWSLSDVKRLLALFESAWGGLLLEGRPTLFSEQSAEARVATLESWRHSPLRFKRSAYVALRGLIMTRYWSIPAIYRATGYPGPPDFGRGLR